jgi:hypothetical protein
VHALSLVSVICDPGYNISRIAASLMREAEFRLQRNIKFR